MNKASRAAQLLGRMSKGKSRHYTDEEIGKRRSRLAEARLKRWPLRESHNVIQEGESSGKGI